MAVDPIIARGAELPDLMRPLILAEEIKNRRETNRLYALNQQFQQQQYAQEQQQLQQAQLQKQTEEQEKRRMQVLLPLAEKGEQGALDYIAKQLRGIDPAAEVAFKSNPESRAAVFSGLRQTLGIEAPAEKSPFGTVSPDKFTPDSLARFQQSGNYADLAPIEKPQGSGSLSLPDGTHISFGTGGQPNYAPTKTGNATRSNLEKAFVDAQGNAMALQGALQGWRPEFSTYAGQFKAAAGNVQEKAGIDVDPQTRQYLTDYNTWRSNVSAALSQYLNQLSGAAISPAEEARLKASFPNDGDGPTEYYQKTLATMRRLSLVQARSAYLLSNPNVTLDSVSLDQMQNIMVAEANKLAAMYEKNGGMTPEQAKQKALQDTRARFGIGGQ